MATRTRARKEATSFLEHLEDLAITIRNAAIILLVFCTAGLLFAEPVLKFLIEPYGEKLQILSPTEGISTLIRVGLTLGSAAASPFVIYQLIGFAIPAFETQQEKRLANLLRFFIIPGALILFLIGASFAWFIMIPAAIDFLANFGVELFQIGWTAERFVPFVLSLTLWVGISFEMPLVFAFLGRLGIVSPRILLRAWRIAIVAIAIIAAAITPTVDPFNMMLVMGPLIALYFLSILLTAITYRARQSR
ncbi:MAG: twin-arginine translocase subunit TatC [Chloroflexi bacterium]|nr:twin-arginine translocase subunit TatC [Chloroflexota bacterium]